MSLWTIEYEGKGFERFFWSLDEYEQAVLVAAVEHVLAPLGIDVCNSEWGKALGDGLYEFRVRKSLHAILRTTEVEVPEALERRADRAVLLRVFCTFHGDRVVLLVGGYDKRRDSSAKRQSREISRARTALRAWKATRS